MFAAFVNGNLEEFTDYTHPRVIALLGGRAAAIAATKDALAELRTQGVKIRAVKVARPLQSIGDKAGQVQAILPCTMTIVVGDKTLNQLSYLFGMSTDRGKTWKFVDLSKIDASELKDVIPEFNPALKVPPLQPAKVEN